MTDNLKTLIFEALGEASMCWEFPEKAGVFQSERAKGIGNRLVEEINSILQPVNDSDITEKVGSGANYRIKFKLSIEGENGITIKLRKQKRKNKFCAISYNFSSV